MTAHIIKPTAIALLKTVWDSHGLNYWSEHLYVNPVVLGGFRYCVCAECFAEMCEVAAQWERDFDSMIEDLRASSERFLGFDAWEEWQRKTR